MITITIFDDEPESAAVLHRAVKAALPTGVQAHIIETNHVSELVTLCEQGTRIDILVADVVTPKGEPSGIEIVCEHFPPSCGTQIIFVSGYLDQALEVYKAEHLYFLLKPIDQNKLQDALARACTALKSQQPSLLRIKIGHKEHLINTRTIAYLESDLHRVRIFTSEGVFETYAKLDDLAAQLPSGFTRCHRSFLVNLAQIKSLNADEIVLHNGTHIPVSRRRMRQAQRDLLNFLSWSAR